MRYDDDASCQIFEGSAHSPTSLIIAGDAEVGRQENDIGSLVIALAIARALFRPPESAG